MENTKKLDLLHRSTMKKRDDHAAFIPGELKKSFHEFLDEGLGIVNESNPFEDNHQEDLNRRYGLMYEQDIYLNRIKSELMFVPAFYIIGPFDYLSGKISMSLKSDSGSKISKSQLSLSLMNEFNLFSHKDLLMNRHAANYIQEKLKNDKESIKLYNSFKLYEIIINDLFHIESRYAHPFDDIVNSGIRNPDDDLELSFIGLINILSADLGFNSTIFINQITKDRKIFTDFVNWIKETITNIYARNQCMDALDEYDKEEFFDELSEAINRDNKAGHFNILINADILQCFVHGLIPFDAGEIIVFLERLNRYYIYHHLIPAKVNDHEYIYQGLDSFLLA